MKIFKRSVKQLFKFRPFSLKQRKVLNWWCDNSPVKEKDGIIADGAIRSGKTLCMSLSFVIWAMQSFDGHHFGMCGKTIGSFRRNVLFLLKRMLKSRGYKVTDKRTENLIIISRGEVENYFYIFGGKDERSQDLIQGMTLAGVFFDEVALMPESFVNQATARCSVDGSKYWFNCNPDTQYHWFKVNWIDKAKEKNLLYLHFTMDDNLSLTEKKKEQYKSLYTGMFYMRFILGLWVKAEGLIYACFDRDKHVVPTEDRVYTEIYVSNDYGTNHPCIFHMYGLHKGVWYQIKELHHNGQEDGQKTVEEYYSDLVAFTEGYSVNRLYLDNAPIASSFNIHVRRLSEFRTQLADNEVAAGIQDVASALNTGKLKINDCCEHTIKGYGTYYWDEKSDQDKPVKANDDDMDCQRYFVRTRKIVVPPRKPLLKR